MKHIASILLCATFAGADAHAEPEIPTAMLTARVVEFSGSNRDHVFSAPNKSFLTDLAKDIAARATKEDIAGRGHTIKEMAIIRDLKPDDAPRIGSVTMPGISARCAMFGSTARDGLLDVFGKRTAYVRCHSYGDTRYIEDRETGFAQGARAPIINPK